MNRLSIYAVFCSSNALESLYLCAASVQEKKTFSTEWGWRRTGEDAGGAQHNLPFVHTMRDLLVFSLRRTFFLFTYSLKDKKFIFLRTVILMALHRGGGVILACTTKKSALALGDVYHKMLVMALIPLCKDRAEKENGNHKICITVWKVGLGERKRGAKCAWRVDVAEIMLEKPYPIFIQFLRYKPKIGYGYVCFSSEVRFVLVGLLQKWQMDR